MNSSRNQGVGRGKSKFVEAAEAELVAVKAGPFFGVGEEVEFCGESDGEAGAEDADGGGVGGPLPRDGRGNAANSKWDDGDFAGDGDGDLQLNGGGRHPDAAVVVIEAKCGDEESGGFVAEGNATAEFVGFVVHGAVSDGHPVGALGKEIEAGDDGAADEWVVGVGGVGARKERH